MVSIFLRYTIFLLLFSFISLSHAATETWNGSGSAHPEWSFGINWTPTGPPTSGELVFPASAAQKINTNDLAAATVFGPISITGSGYSMNGNSITLNGGVNLLGTGATATLSMPFILTTSQVCYVESATGILQINAVLSGAGGLTKFGPGALIITQNPTATGQFRIDGGAIDMRAILASKIIIGNGTLAGSGSVGGIQSLGSGAAVSPGNLGLAGIGTLTSTGNVLLTSSDVVYFNLGTNAVDSLVVQGTCNFANAVTSFVHSGAVTGLTANTDYTIITNDGTDIVQFGATLDTWLLSNFTLDGQNYQLNRIAGTGNDVTIRRVTNTASTTALTVTPASTAAGASVTLEATVSSSLGFPNGGTVSFYDGFTKIGGDVVVDITGKASTSTTTLTPGNHSLRAVFNGNNGGTVRARSQSAAVTHTVTGTATSVTLNVVTNGAGATLSGTVSNGIPTTGAVNFYQDGVLIGSGFIDASRNYTFNTAALNAGTYAFAVEYPAQGTTTYSISSTVNYVKPGGTATTTTVTSSTNPAAVSTMIDFVATVSGGATSGTVTFYDGAAAMGSAAVGGGGTATFSTSALTTGSHSITAKFTGSATHISSTSLALSQTMTGPSPGGSGGSGGSSTDNGGSCGLGSGFATMLIMLLCVLRLRLFSRSGNGTQVL